jgi:hypothetical protein
MENLAFPPDTGFEAAFKNAVPVPESNGPTVNKPIWPLIIGALTLLGVAAYIGFVICKTDQEKRNQKR